MTCLLEPPTPLDTLPELAAQEHLLPLLASYNLVPQLLRELIIDRAIASISCTPNEITCACEQYYESLQLGTEDQQQRWRSRYSLTEEQVEQLATRDLRLEKFKQITWQHKLNSYFLTRKDHLDKVIYSLLRTSDPYAAAELYFRLQEGEASFAYLAGRYSEGPEAQTGGLVGPTEFGSLSPHLADLLQILPEGTIHPPVTLGNWQVIVRVEKRIPARLDEAMRQRLLQENFEIWLQNQMKHLSPADQVWLRSIG